MHANNKLKIVVGYEDICIVTVNKVYCLGNTKLLIPTEFVVNAESIVVGNSLSCMTRTGITKCFGAND